VFIGDILDICGGVIIGLGHSVMRFCVKPVGACHTKGHRAKKVLLMNDMFYIRYTRAGQACFEPSLPKKFLPKELEVEDLPDKSKPFVEWLAYFERIRANWAVKRSPGSWSAHSWEKIEAPLVQAYSAAHRTQDPKMVAHGPVDVSGC
jgi:hypothetical protein